ncbi:MAG: T9SS type A sorting domain-containing protein [Bacteroidia bacterium]|nr:T9SS type A sorting domain-containing protein [Bacteroidia bacterium]
MKVVKLFFAFLFCNTISAQVTCTASFCFTAYLDSVNNKVCVTLQNLSVSNDSISSFTWVGSCGYSGVGWNPAPFCYTSSLCNPFIVTIQIQTLTGCNSSFSDTILIGQTCGTTTGIEKFISFDLKVFPNPFNSTLTFQSELEEFKELIIYDFTGKIIDRKKISGKSFVYENPLLEKGILFFEISDKQNTIKRGKLIFE